MIFNHFLPAEYCPHFNALHAGLSILSNADHYRTNNECADNLLHWYVENYRKLYGSSSIVFTVHCIQHLAPQTLEHGPLDDVTAYPFENYMRFLKIMIHRPSDTLAQLFHGFFVKSNFSHLMNKRNEDVQNFHKLLNSSNTELPFGCGIEFQKIVYENFELTSKQPDNCCYLKNNSVFLIEQITVHNNNPAVIGKVFKHLSSFLNYPGNSQDLGLFIAKGHSQSQIFYANDIMKKAVALKLKEIYYIMPLLHSTCD